MEDSRPRQQHLRQFLRHERLSVVMALSETKHNVSPGQTRTRPLGENEVHYTDEVWSIPPPRSPARSRDPGPQVAGERHSGVANEVLLDVRGPLLGRDWGDVPAEVEELAARRRLHEALLRTPDGKQALVEAMRKCEQEEATSRSSNKMPGKRKRKKRRKKKVPKSSSSTSSRRVVDVGGKGVHERDDFGKEAAIEYVQRANVPATHSVVHAKPLNSVHSKEVVGCMDEMNKLIKEKGITGNQGEEIILKNGVPAMSLYSDRTRMCISGRCWPDWEEDRRRYVRRLGWTVLLLTSSSGFVFYEERVKQTLSGAPSVKTVKDLTWLLFYVPPDFEFQRGRVNAFCTPFHRMLKLGHWTTRDSRGGRQDGEG